MSRLASMRAPRARKASRWGSRRRRPMTSPPGGGMTARPKRARSGPPSRNEARMRSDSSASTSPASSTCAAQISTSLSERQATRAPRSSMRASMASTSRMRGTLEITTSSSVRRAAAMSGSAAFLFPAGTTVPDSGTPPSMMNFSMAGRARRMRIREGARRSARVTAMPSEISREEAWNLFCEWTESPSLRRHVLAVEAAMRAYARRFGEDEELWGVTGLLHDLDYERHPDLETGHPRKALELFRERGYPQDLIDAVAGHADFLGVTRESPLAKTLYAVDELSGFIAACALVRPTGLEGMKPKSVRKKLKQPSFAAKVDRAQIAQGIEELGVDEAEHIQLVIDAMAANAVELG